MIILIRVVAKTWYSETRYIPDYLKNTAPRLHGVFFSLKENTTEDKMERSVCKRDILSLSIFRDLIDSLDIVFYKDSFNFIEDLRDTQINELKMFFRT